MLVQDYLPGNCRSHQPLRSVELVVVHGISAVNVDPDNRYSYRLIRQILIDYGFGCHTLIDRSGREWQLVPFDEEAWHAGESRWKGRNHCNEFSLGVELMGGPDEPYTDAQYARLGLRCAKWLSEHGLAADQVVGHNDVAPDRKTDPYSTFDWPRLRAQLSHVEGSA